MATIETITLRLNDAASPEEFAAANARVENGFLTQQPGYNPGTRVTTVSDDGPLDHLAALG